MPPEPVESVAVEDEPKQEVTYASAPTGASVSRRQFRFLLSLTLLNTLLLTAFVAGPAISRMVAASREKYRQWKSERDEAAAIQKFDADFKAALARAFAPDTVAYDEQPDRAATLIAKGGDYRAVASGFTPYFPPKPWQLPAGFFPASPGLPWDNDAPTVFAAGRRTPAGVERLVRVTLVPEQLMQAMTTPDRRDAAAPEARRYEIRQTRTFSAHTYGTSSSGFDDRGVRSLRILQPAEHQTTVTWTKGSSWENGRIDADLKGVLRVFAGQADPQDASHFTIAYELDGRPGVIDGWLRDDELVVLQPRGGRIVDQDVPYGRNRLWNPYGEPPATHAPDPLPPLIPQGQR